MRWVPLRLKLGSSTRGLGTWGFLTVFVLKTTLCWTDMLAELFEPLLQSGRSLSQMPSPAMCFLALPWVLGMSPVSLVPFSWCFLHWGRPHRLQRLSAAAYRRLKCPVGLSLLFCRFESEIPQDLSSVISSLYFALMSLYSIPAPLFWRSVHVMIRICRFISKFTFACFFLLLKT